MFAEVGTSIAGFGANYVRYSSNSSKPLLSMYIKDIPLGLNTILEKFVLPGAQVDIVGAVNGYKLGPYRYKVAGVATPILPLNGDILQSLITVAVPPGFSLAAVALAQFVPVGSTSYSQTNP